MAADGTVANPKRIQGIMARKAVQRANHDGSGMAGDGASRIDALHCESFGKKAPALYRRLLPPDTASHHGPKEQNSG